MKLKLIILAIGFLGLLSCSDGISKKEQEKFIRQEYPLRRHKSIWKKNAKSVNTVLAFNGPVDYNSVEYALFLRYWLIFDNEGLIDDTIEVVDYMDAEEFIPDYEEYFSSLHSDMAGDEDYSTLQLIIMDLNWAASIQSGEGLNEIWEYLFGHVKALTPIPVITAMEYVKKGKNGMDYWRVHFDDDATHNVHVFYNDQGLMDCERILLSI